MKKLVLAGTIILSAGIAFGQMKELLKTEETVYEQSQALPAYYQKYLAWIIGGSHSARPLSPQTLFHRNEIIEPSLKWVDLPGRVRLQYAEQGRGSGMPIILLHGFTDSWHSYETVMKQLPANIHVYAVSQRGHGNSDRPDNYNPKEFAADIDAMMEQLAIRCAIVVGHSMGATVAQRLAIDFPNRVSALVLEGAFASFPKNQAVNDFGVTVAQLSDPIDGNFVREFQAGTLANKIDPVYFELLVGESMKVPVRVWKGVMSNLLPVDYVSEVQKFRKPALLIWGDQDVFSPRNDQELFLKALSNSSLIVYKGIGHSPHWEQPARFANDIAEFVKRYENEVCD